MNANELKDFTKKVAEKVTNELKAKGVTSINIDEAARAMSLQPGMVLHPVCSGIDDIKTGDPIDGGINAEGKKVVNGFAYLDTKEGVRITESQISRLGNGMTELEGKTKAARFAHFCSLCMEHADTIEVKVQTKYQNTLSNGQTQGLPVFSLTY